MVDEDAIREREIRNVTLVGSIYNFFLIIFKFVAGIVGNSAAMIADAVHSLSDFATDIVVLFCIHVSSKPEDADHDYGHGKYETFATAIIGLVLLAVGIGLLWNGGMTVAGVINGEILSGPGELAFVAAVISIIVKESLYRYTIAKGKKYKSSAVIANAWHHRSDALSSIGTALGIGGAIVLGDNWRILDPIAAIVVSALIIKTAVQLVKPCIGELLESSLPDETEDEIRRIILSFPSVSSPHHLRTRRIGSHYAIEVHIRMDGKMTLAEAHDVASAIESKLKSTYGAQTHVGIHMEPVK